MVKRLLLLLLSLAAAVAKTSFVFEVAGVACVAAWAGLTWGAAGVFIVVGVALLAKSLEADLAGGPD